MVPIFLVSGFGWSLTDFIVLWIRRGAACCALLLRGLCRF